ncbi:conserved domain protein [Actinomyces sp. oral taxon 170 str. F0386]|nr:conserved domain protein [Actinomyces sp. oral taxon 170 str. F0386]
MRILAAMHEGVPLEPPDPGRVSPVVSTSVTKEPAARSGRQRNRGIMRFLCGGVYPEPAFVTDVDTHASFATC